MAPNKLLLLFLLICCSPETKKNIKIDHRILILSGEITSSTVIVQGRFAESDTLINSDIPGQAAVACFQFGVDPSFNQFKQTDWTAADYNSDFIVKSKIDNLASGTTYYYRIKSLINNDIDTTYSSIGQFRTLPDAAEERAVSFAISTGFNYEKFYGIDSGSNERSKGLPAAGIDRDLGFEAFEAVQALAPDFFIANGDVVYYDKPGNRPELWAKDIVSMRAKWHRYFSMPRNRELCKTIPVYYLKDDHDHRFNDCDSTDVKFSEPSHQLGIRVFREQLPLVTSNNESAITYRTVRAGNLLQLWFVEGRDYRSPNLQQDGADKTIWGSRQKQWLKNTLLQSEATFKLLISPTPLIGPDDAYKKDNHTNPGGFQTEQQEFFAWLLKNDFLSKNFYILCGDRHWQYHTQHPSGLEELSSGAFVNQNSRPGRKPGDPESTDLEAKIKAFFLQYDEWGGGFLYVTVSVEGGGPVVNFSFRDTKGNVRYQVNKKANNEV